MKYYAALKKKENLQHAMTQMNLEDIMLSEINQSQKEKNKKQMNKIFNDTTNL